MLDPLLITTMKEGRKEDFIPNTGVEALVLSLWSGTLPDSNLCIAAISCLMRFVVFWSPGAVLGISTGLEGSCAGESADLITFGRFWSEPNIRFIPATSNKIRSCSTEDEHSIISRLLNKRITIAGVWLILTGNFWAIYDLGNQEHPQQGPICNYLEI